MPSLRQLLARHASLLLLDAASTRVQVGWLAAGEPARWETADGEAGIAVFQCLEKLGVDVTAAGAYVFCDGPGSVLGVRTTAMALRTWSVVAPRPTFAYHSLALVAHALGQPDLTVIADARRDLWHAFRLGGQLQRAPLSELSGKLVTPDNFRHWSPAPPGLCPTPYVLADLWPRIADVDILRETTTPDAFLHEEPTYVTWTPQVHRAP